MNDFPSHSDRLLRAVMAGVLAWGALLSIGVGLFGIDAETGGVRFAPNALRGLIVLAFVGGFLTLWLAALEVRRRRRRSSHPMRPGPNPR
ncbi:MAG: hypothetical protein FJ297_07560 [Planctomycetes bacterium]|nr:hypothetical protein [Planctomycetota bacterium]